MQEKNPFLDTLYKNKGITILLYLPNLQEVTNNWEFVIANVSFTKLHNSQNTWILLRKSGADLQPPQITQKNAETNCLLSR